MTENPQDAETEQPRSLEPLMSDAERIAVRTLTEESVPDEVDADRELMDSIFTALSHPGRRYILTYLLRSEGYVTMTELVDYVMDRTTAAASDGELRRRITVQLTHTHLPTLVDEDLLTYNMERQLINQTEKTQLAEPYLKLALVQQDQLSAKED